jgi:hypothetical protein
MSSAPLFRTFVLFTALALAACSAEVAQSPIDDGTTEDEFTATSDARAQGAIETAAKGLYFLSESDHALVWVKSKNKPSGYLTAADVKGAFATTTDTDAMADKPLASLASESVPFETFAARFKPVPGEDADNFAYHEQMTKVLGAVRTNLKNPKVIRFGRKSGNNLVGAISVYIVGTLPSGKIGGLFTVAVET